MFDVAKKHGLQLEEEPEYGGRAYLEKQDYILFKQKEQLAAQEQKLEELTMKIEDVEALVDEVADIAYEDVYKRQHQAIVCTHPDGHNHSGNIHVHIVINSLRIYEVPLLPYMRCV